MNGKEYFNRHGLKCMTIGFGVALCMVFSLVGVYTIAESPDFCGFCHAMKFEHATWEHGMHRGVACIECHLPNDNLASHLVAKAQTGMVDVYHETLRDYPAHLKLTDEGKTYVNDNCLRCHEVTNDRVHSSLEENKNCMKCHVDVAHGSKHLEGGIRVE